MSDSNGFVALFAEEHHIGEMQGSLLFKNASLSLLAMGAGMPFDEIDLLNDHLLLLGQDLQDPATLPLLFATDDHDQIILLDMEFRSNHL